MTASSWPNTEIEWEVDPEGVLLTLGNQKYDPKGQYNLNLISVRELRDDMEEAAYLSRGLEKVDCFAMEVKEYDKVVIGGDLWHVTSTLESRDGWVLQFSHDEMELILPLDHQLTVWRAVE